MDARGPADLAFTNGAVYTVDAARRWAQAVAVRDGRIALVGSDAEVRSMIGPATDVHDLGGKMLLPGFQDAHVHPSFAGLGRLSCDLGEAYSREEYAAIVRAYAERHPDRPWITGDGWSMDVFPGGLPTKGELDVLVPDRPVYLTNRDGHGAWVNSVALELAGVTRETPDPKGGRIERDRHGDPSGVLHEGAMELVGAHAPPVSRQQWEEAILTAQGFLHSLGVTAWQDAIVDRRDGTLEAYLRLTERGALTARVVGALWWDRDRGDEQVEDLIEARAESDVGRFRGTSVKIMQDGVVENFTAGVLEPYLDENGRPTDNCGLSFVDPELLKAHVTRLDREGFQIHFHAIGERAVREALDAIESARTANGRNDNRHHIAHIQVVHPEDIRRFRELAVVANAQPLWAVLEGQMVRLTIPFLGPERTSWQYPFRSLVRSGATLAFGSDWSVSSPNPIWEMHVAVNRVAPAGYPYAGGTEAIDEVFLPEERLDLPTAIHAATMGSAFVNHLERDTGSIEVGKLADLVVLDRNLFDPPADEIHEARVLLTLVEGAKVFAAPSFA